MLLGDKDKVYIVSGCDATQTGTGRFVDYLREEIGDEVDWIILNRDRIPKTNRLFVYINYVQKKLVNILTRFQLLFFSKKKILLIHPQSIGISLTRKLIEKNRIFFFVLDNHFFCVKSYNTRAGYKPCFDCISNPDMAHKHKCNSFPKKTSLESYKKYYECLRENSQKITFLFQNLSQYNLAKKSLGDIDGHVVGLYTREFGD